MQKIKDFLKKHKYDILIPLLQTIIIILFIILFAIFLAAILTNNKAKRDQRLQQCMYLFPQNTAEQCEFLINK